MARKNTVFLLLACLFAVALGACTPTMATRGNFLDDEKLKSLQIGVSTKAEVEQKLGSPTTIDPFDQNTWFYVGEKTSAKAFFTPKVDARNVVVLKFNQDGLLADAQQMNEKDGKKVVAVKKKTPAPGREMNAFEQFLSNIGKFNQDGPSGSNKSPGR